MDFQGMVDAMNEQSARDRGNYHLTYGQLVKALKEAPKDATFDKQVKGIGSWRGSYTEIALFTEEHGLYCQDEEFTGDYKDYDKWEKKHSTTVKELPTNANKLGALLESIIGEDFIGYKGGNFTIAEYKPLWLEEHDNNCDSVAVIGIDKDLNLITKKLDEDE
jgi:hypothetical protein